MSTIRTCWPLAALNQTGSFKCRWVTNDDVRQMIEGNNYDSLRGHNIYILGRIHGPGEENPLGDVMEKDAKLVYDVDDDLLDGSRFNGYGDWVRNTGNLADAITVSTPELAERMADALPDKPIYVLPNHVNVHFYAKVSSKAARFDERLTIGLLGTPTHFFDWALVVDSLIAIREKYPEVQVMCAGYRPEFLKRVPGLVFYAGKPFPQWPQLLRQVDIRLCTLEDDPFNESKSAIAALEAMAAVRPIGRRLGGAVPVCSDHTVYKRVIQHRNNGLLVKDDNWYDALELLITNRELLKKLAVSGHRWVKKNRGLSHGTRLWAKAYQMILGGEDGRQLQHPIASGSPRKRRRNEHSPVGV